MPATLPRGRSSRRPVVRAAAAVGAAAVLAAVAGAYLLGGGRARRAQDSPVIQRLTFRHGQVSSARFAPDAATVVLAAIWDGQPSDLFTTRLGSAESRALGMPGADLLSVSPSGDLAVLIGGRLRDRTDVRPTGTIARVPLAGGAPRDLIADAQEADWSRDDLAFVRDVGGRSRLELPAGTVLHESATGWISHPRVSPAGDQVAFLEHPNRGDDLGSVMVVDRRGRARTLASGFVTVQGLAWSPRGDLLLFTGARGGVFRALLAVDLAGAERLLYQAPAILTLHDVAPDGKVLVTHSSPRFGVMVRTDPLTPERDLAWLDGSDVADLSADGQTLLFVETRAGGGPTLSTFLRRTDGGPAVLLGRGDAWSLSGDGAWALTVPVGRAPRPLVLLPTGAGETRTLAAEGLDHFAAIFFPSAQRILCTASPEGSAPRLYVRDVAGGPPRAVTPPGVIHEPAVTPDGSALAVVGADQRPWLYPVDAGEPRLIEGTEPGDLPARFSSDGKHLFLFRRGEWPARVFRLELATGKKEPWLEIMPAEPAGSRGIIGRFRITPDGRSYAYTYDRSLSDLFMLSGIDLAP